MSEDYIVRAGAADSAIRAFAITSRGLVEEARQRHQTSPVVTAALGRLLTGAAMMGVMMKGDQDLLTIQIKSGGPMRGDDGDGRFPWTREGLSADGGCYAAAQRQREIGCGRRGGAGYHECDQGYGIERALCGADHPADQRDRGGPDLLFCASEQVPSSVGLGVLMNRDNTVKQAGGFIIQLLPFTDEKIIAALEKKIGGLSSVTELLGTGTYAGEPAGTDPRRFWPGVYRADSGVLFLRLLQGAGGKSHRQSGKTGSAGNDCRRETH